MAEGSSETAHVHGTDSLGGLYESYHGFSVVDDCAIGEGNAECPMMCILISLLEGNNFHGIRNYS